MSQAATLPTQLGSAPVFDEDTLYEVVNGQRVEPPRMGVYETWFAAVLIYELNRHQMSRPTGHVALPEMLFLIDAAADLQRRPNVAFVSYDRWPRDRRLPTASAWHVVPDLAVEVVSPSDAACEMVAKTEEYFRAGVRLVWLFFPTQRLVYVYEDRKSVRILDARDTLDGGTVLPGFALRLSSLFESDLSGDSPTPESA
jgi:Uma2 family endonuclease